MQIKLFSCVGGVVLLPTRDGALVSREDGGNLIINPPRDVWERGELNAIELRGWSYLVAATASAMLSCLPQLEGGCINYWEAGNWALNEAARPVGVKRAPDHRSVHLHLLGRNMNAKSPNWQWGESPIFPRYAEKAGMAQTEDRLTPAETHNIVSALRQALIAKYEFAEDDMSPTAACPACSYPVAGERAEACPECAN
ncbi:hypothetical protein [Hyphococcus sp.]|uniref:hypothetical protein n=1 Tax=Hyphococcus sp. TaxID=2038636 RepID=UPI003751B3B1